MEVEHIIEQAHANAVNHGWVGNVPRPIAEHTSLLHEEVSELFGCWRDGLESTAFYYRLPGDRGLSRDQYDEEGNRGKPEGIPAELADVVIRACQMSGEYGIDLVRAIREKMAYNATRPFKHGRVH
jgi:NTP pyrophosphatase (non-canonical NTP hydrolase)